MQAPPQTDLYRTARGQKSFGYPMGQAALFLDGRIVRDVEVTDARLANFAVGPGLSFIPAAPVAIPASRAVYVIEMSFSYNMDNLLNFFSTYQLWANGKYICGGTMAKSAVPLEVYLPPESLFNLYLMFVNNTGNPQFIYMSLHWITFNADADIWDYGTGNNIENPAIGALPWP